MFVVRVPINDTWLLVGPFWSFDTAVGWVDDNAGTWQGCIIEDVLPVDHPALKKEH